MVEPEGAARTAPLGVARSLSAVLDADGRVRHTDEALRLLLDVSEEQIRDRTLTSFVHHDDRSSVRATVHAAAVHATPAVIDARFRAADAEVRWLRCGVEPGSAAGTVRLIAHDVTDLQRPLHRLRDADERFGLAMVNAPIGMALVGLDGRMLEVNEALCQLVGRSADELRGMTTFDITHPDDVADDAHYGGQLVLGRAPDHQTLEKRYLHADGSIVWGLLKVSVVRDRERRPLYEIGQVVDITQRKQVELQLLASEERFRRLADNARDVVYRLRVGPTLELEYVSPSVERLSGYTVADLRAAPGRLFGELAREVAAPGGTDGSSVAPREPRRLWWRHRDGGTVTVEDRSVVLQAEDGVVVEGIVRDVSDRVRQEELAAQALARERAAVQRLHALDEMKDTFLSAVSHELRTPLTSLLGLSHLLASRRTELSEDRVTELVAGVTRNAARLDRLLTDLLDVDRLTRGGALDPDLAETDLTALVERVVEQLPDHDGRLVVELPPVRAVVDGPKVERMVQNLLANAVRHTPDGTSVWLRLVEADGGVVLSVEDAGPGVPEELREEIFEPFEVGYSDARRTGGTGIGLALVDRFARLHGGRAWVDDRPGGGARFQVWLPDAAAPSA